MINMDEIAVKTLMTFQECLNRLDNLQAEIQKIKKHIGLNDKIELR